MNYGDNGETTYESQQRVKGMPIGFTCTPNERKFLDRVRELFRHVDSSGEIATFDGQSVLKFIDFPGINLKELVQ